MYIYFKTKKKPHSETWDKKAPYVDLKLSPYKISISH